MMGPVHENDTSASVNAMKKMLSRPVVVSAFESMELDHFDGRVMSKPPRNEMPNTTSRAKNARLNHALVASSLSFDGPKISVMAMPRVR